MVEQNEKIDSGKIVHQISYNPEKRVELFLQVPAGQKGDILLRLSKHIKYHIISKISKEELVDVLSHLDADEATDVLQLLPENKREQIMVQLNGRLKKEISLLLQFDPETAAGLMNVDYIQVEITDTIASVAKQVKVHEKRTGKLPAILAMESGKFVGYLPVHELGFGKPGDKTTKYIKKIKTIKHDANTGEVLELFRSNPHNKVVVMGHTGNVMGIIYSDDVLKVLHEEESASLYDFAGVSDEESVFDSAKRKIKYRYKWLIINLGTAFLAAFTVGLFGDTISKYVLLAVYMPIVAGMGGNAATQTLAVLVRGITLKQIDLKTMWRTLKSELGAGFVNGIINGVIIVGVVFIKDRNLLIGLVLAMAMIINLLVAAFFGTVVPLIMKKLGKDPASSATIFITTATDVFGFFVFLSLATLILK
ncbi:MAG: magnesium transporter [Candidatus Staskawiczbacteria bacterium]|nr:magnesium transporter [Candidatus Staskawiczbacteria bacterium]